MAKKRNSDTQTAISSDNLSNDGYLGNLGKVADWQEQIAQVALRFNRDYRGEAIELPEEVQAMPIAQEQAAGLLQSKLASPFWQLAKPQKNQRCLDIGCGVSFLIYPWRDWEALFYGVEVSTEARDILNARAPQLNSKLFKGMQLGAAHQLDYEAGQFDLAIATGVSCYYPLSYWQEVLLAVKKVLKPGGFFVFDVVDAALPLAENWAILETYLGAEVFLESATDWQQAIKLAGGKVINTLPGELFQLHKVKF
jgi:SAM-dependent methyltransferase